ncbi:MAG: accessory gene regulator B family protein [Ruminiclostridium sp.]|nr:accessory gene regulator B family protein [Ruminiclostridium sp.]
MIKETTEIILSFMKKNIHIEDDMIDVYRYGIEITLSSVLNFTLIFVISFIMNDFLLAVFFLLSFIPLRSFCGGYHASTYFKCNLIFSLSFTLCCCISKLLNLYFSNEIIIFCGVIIATVSVSSISILAPVINPHKPIDTYQKKKHKIFSIIISFLISVIGIFLITFKLQYGFLMIVTLFTVAVMAKIEKTIQRRCSHNVKEEHC